MIYDEALALRQFFLAELQRIAAVTVCGKQDHHDRVGVISVTFAKQDNAEAAARLESAYGILIRCGLHCAPSAHKTLGTFPEGTVRFSLGPFNTREDIAGTAFFRRSPSI